jgi:hypothetical protein
MACMVVSLYAGNDAIIIQGEEMITTPGLRHPAPAVSSGIRPSLLGMWTCSPPHKSDRVLYAPFCLSSFEPG